MYVHAETDVHHATATNKGAAVVSLTAALADASKDEGMEKKKKKVSGAWSLSCQVHWIAQAGSG